MQVVVEPAVPQVAQAAPPPGQYGVAAGHFAVAVVPLWQLKQLPVIPVWSKPPATSQLLVSWQDSQVFGLGTWFGGLPVAVLPLWQLKQLPVIAA